MKGILMRFNYILTINNPFLYTWPRDSGALYRIDLDFKTASSQQVLESLHDSRSINDVLQPLTTKKHCYNMSTRLQVFATMHNLYVCIMKRQLKTHNVTE